jgi:hypothetical protein
MPPKAVVTPLSSKPVGRFNRPKLAQVSCRYAALQSTENLKIRARREIFS